MENQEKSTELTEALVNLYNAFTRDGVLVLESDIECNSAPEYIKKVSELLDKKNFCIFQKIAKIILKSPDNEQLQLALYNINTGNKKVDIFFKYIFNWWKKTSKIKATRLGLFRAKFMTQEKKLRKELENL